MQSTQGFLQTKNSSKIVKNRHFASIFDQKIGGQKGGKKGSKKGQKRPKIGPRRGGPGLKHVKKARSRPLHTEKPISSAGFGVP